MTDTKALDNVVEQNRLAIGEFCRPDDILWIEGQQAAVQLAELKASRDGWKNTAETSYKRVMELSAALDEMREALEYLSNYALTGWRQEVVICLDKARAVLAKYPKEKK